jgi:hypothetical protein
VALIVAFASAADTAVGNESRAIKITRPINRAFFITHSPSINYANLWDYQIPNIAEDVFMQIVLFSGNESDEQVSPLNLNGGGMGKLLITSSGFCRISQITRVFQKHTGNCSYDEYGRTGECGDQTENESYLRISLP